MFPIRFIEYLHVIIFVSMKYEKGISFHYLQLQKPGHKEIKTLAQCHIPSSVAKKPALYNLLTSRLVSALFLKPHFIKTQVLTTDPN